MNTIMIEKLGSVSMVSGVVRIQCMTTGADGEERVSGELMVPAAQFGQVTGGLQAAGKQLRERLDQACKDQEEKTEQ